MTPCTGDWIENGALTFRSDRRRIAEVVAVRGNRISIRIDGEPHEKDVKMEDFHWWKPFTTTGEVPPAWLKRGESYRVGSNRAIIMTTKPGWLSFLESCPDYSDVFRMVEYEKFKEHWRPDKPRTAWDIMNGPDPYGGA